MIITNTLNPKMFENLQLNEPIAKDIDARKDIAITSIINAGQIISMFVIQQKNAHGILIFNKSTTYLKLALKWYNDCIKPANEE